MKKLLVASGPTDIAVAYCIEAISEQEAIGWAFAYRTANPASDSELVAELVRCNPKTELGIETAGTVLRSAIKPYQSPTGDLPKQFEKVGRRFFIERLRSFDPKKDRPWKICKMAGSIEAAFDFPDWLGDLWNLCDWCEEDTEPGPAFDLTSYIAETVHAYDEESPEHD